MASKQTYIKHNLRLFATLNGKNVPQPLVYYSEDSEESDDTDIELIECGSNENNPAAAEAEEDLVVLD